MDYSNFLRKENKKVEENNKKNNIYKNLMIIVVTALVTCIITTIAVYNVPNKPQTNDFGFFNKLSNAFIKEDKSYNNLNKKIDEIDSKLTSLYIGDINKEKLINGALEGYVSALGDEYTEYITESEIEELMQVVNGSYVGVGLYIAQVIDSNEILVVGIIKDSPAEKAGIHAGDVVKKVDGVEYTGEELTTASNKMKGEVGTHVKVTVLREGKEIEFDIIREKIKFQYIACEKLENDIGYIQISSFEGGCVDDFKKAYADLESQGIKSLIVDLRNNGGGLVDQSLDIAELFVPNESTLLITKDKQNEEKITKSSEEPIIKIPVVLLVNEYTASASEILTGAIRENIDAKVIGTTTFGKGIIQGVYLLDDEKTGLKITIQEYFTPKHNKIHKKGIEPDIKVELPEELQGKTTIEKDQDVQLQRAIEELKK